ncbi:MAG TPA: ATP-binding protein [Verrucomicrobiae bacterium]|nr:ATP-binding protein [Verrucomicrobiae bacterium]
MSIRTKLLLYFAGMLLFGLLLIAGWAYYELFIENRAAELEAGLATQGNTLLEEIGEVFLFAVLPALILTTLGGWFLLSRAVAPITALSRAAERVDLRHLGERLPELGTGDELDRLTKVFNSMLARLDESFNRVREFTLHASHELKTPLAVMRGEIETALRENYATPEQRHLLGGHLDEIERLTKIVDGLTLLARADAGQFALDLRPVRLDELLRECREDLLVLAADAEISVELPVCEAVTLTGDRHRLRQLLLILGDNALKYNVPKGRVTLTLARQDQSLELTFANTGPGIEGDNPGRVFDRFYRGRNANRESQDGCGLGLSIAESIVRAHGGTIAVESVPGHVTRFIVRLPAAPPPGSAG